jgi:hypothetical protein
MVAVNSALVIVFQLNRHSMMISPYWVVLIVCPFAYLRFYAGIPPLWPYESELIVSRKNGRGEYFYRAH